MQAVERNTGAVLAIASELMMSWRSTEPATDVMGVLAEQAQAGGMRTHSQLVGEIASQGV